MEVQLMCEMNKNLWKETFEQRLEKSQKNTKDTKWQAGLPLPREDYDNQELAAVFGTEIRYEQ